MLHHRADPRKVSRAYLYSIVAKAEGVEFFYFTPGKVDIENETIMGKYYENGVWIDKKYPFPDAIYNASILSTVKSERIIDYLSERIPFTSHSVGDKLSVHKRIEKGKKFTEFLIPTFELSQVKELLDMMNRYPKIVIKPVTGNQGDGILFIEKKDNENFMMNDAGKILHLKKEDLLNLASHKMKGKEYIVQRFISCQMKSGHAYDFRLHVQKNGEGKWVITSIYPRIGPLGSVTSNLGSGGYTAFLDGFLQKEFNDDWLKVKRTLEDFSLNFSNHFDTLYDDVSFDELGIDVGLDKNQGIWLFEVNWRPGPPVIYNCELDVARNTVLYAKYLTNINKNFSSKNRNRKSRKD